MSSLKGVSLTDALRQAGLHTPFRATEIIWAWFTANRRPILEGAGFVHPDPDAKRMFDVLLEAARNLGGER